MTSPARPRTCRRSTLVGIALIGVGMLFMMRELGWVPQVSAWTILWLAVGGFLLVSTVTGARRGWFAPLAIFGIGVVMLLRDLTVIRPGFAVWPIIVIALGLAMLIDATQTGDSEAPRVWR